MDHRRGSPAARRAARAIALLVLLGSLRARADHAETRAARSNDGREQTPTLKSFLLDQPTRDQHQRQPDHEAASPQDHQLHQRPHTAANERPQTLPPESKFRSREAIGMPSAPLEQAWQAWSPLPASGRIQQIVAAPVPSYAHAFASSQRQQATSRQYQRRSEVPAPAQLWRSPEHEQPHRWLQQSQSSSQSQIQSQQQQQQPRLPNATQLWKPLNLADFARVGGAHGPAAWLADGAPLEARTLLADRRRPAEPASQLVTKWRAEQDRCERPSLARLFTGSLARSLSGARNLLSGGFSSIKRLVTPGLALGSSVLAAGVPLVALLLPDQWQAKRREWTDSSAQDRRFAGLQSRIDSLMGWLERSVEHLPNFPRLHPQECIKRSICEAHNEPDKYGAIGFMLRLLFPASNLSSTDKMDDMEYKVINKYRHAAGFGLNKRLESNGTSTLACREKYEDCLVSLLDIARNLMGLFLN